MKKILLINNDLDAMHLLKLWLENKAYEVRITTSKEEAFKVAEEFDPALVIADILQNEAIEQLKKMQHTKDIPILLMSGYTRGNENINLNIDDIIEKPFNLPLLEIKVARLLKHAG